MKSIGRFLSSLVTPSRLQAKGLFHLLFLYSVNLVFCLHLSYQSSHLSVSLLFNPLCDTVPHFVVCETFAYIAFLALPPVTTHDPHYDYDIPISMNLPYAAICMCVNLVQYLSSNDRGISA